MDERVKSTYEKIYAELFRLILAVCALSVVIKTVVMGMNAVDCIPEFPILFVSPLYLVARSQMLGVTQVSAAAPKSKQNLQIALVCAMMLALFIFAAALRSHGENIAWSDLSGFAILYIALFLLVNLGFRKWSEHQQKKLDDKYDKD